MINSVRFFFSFFFLIRALVCVRVFFSHDKKTKHLVIDKGELEKEKEEKHDRGCGLIEKENFAKWKWETFISNLLKSWFEVRERADE